jgi:membrane protein implicated in regulation of membrane protease activity
MAYLGVLVLVAALLLPYVVGVLSIGFVAFIGWGWLRFRAKRRAGRQRSRRGRLRSRPGCDRGRNIRATTFRVRLATDPSISRWPAREVDCRVAHADETGQSPLVGGEFVTGRARRTIGGTFAVSRLEIGQNGTRCRAAVAMPAAAVQIFTVMMITIAAGRIYYDRSALYHGLVTQAEITVLVILGIAVLILLVRALPRVLKRRSPEKRKRGRG